MSTVVYNVKIKGDPEELLNKLHQWIENGLMKGRVSGDRFSVKEIDKRLVKDANQSLNGSTVSVIEGVVENNVLTLSAEMTTRKSFLPNVIGLMMFVTGISLAILSQNLRDGLIIMAATVFIYSFRVFLLRRRVRNDLDTFVRILNSKSKVQLIR